MTPAVVHVRFATGRFFSMPLKLVRGLVRATGLFAALGLAAIDAAFSRLVTEPTGIRVAHARAAWLHRWSRVVRRLLGLHLIQRGYAPVSGIVAANHTNLLDAIVLASVRPCVFVAGVNVKDLPIVGFLARLAGTLFVDHRSRHDVARMNFVIQRAIHRRLLVIVFPECGRGDARSKRRFASSLFQPAVEIGCSLTGAGISYLSTEDGSQSPFARGIQLWRLVLRVLMNGHVSATLAFAAPTFRAGDRKRLARQIDGEVLDLKRLAAQAG